jgi:TPR repeat protein
VGERIEEIESKAAAGDAAAQIAFARQCDEDGKNEEAVVWLRRAVASGHRAAKTALAEHLVSRAPYNVFEGIRWALEAIHDGDAEAAHLLAVVTAEGLGIPQSWQGALDYLVKAAENGHALAQGELAALAGRWDIANALVSGAGTAREDWRRLRQTIDVAAWLAAPRAREMSQAPRLAVAEKFLAPAACDWLIERARPQTRRAAVFDVERGGHRLLDTRSNSGAYLNVAQMDMVTVAARARIAALSNLPLAGFEDSAILHYGTGQEYKPHYDFLDTTPAMAQEIASGGQRVATLLIYLNDGYDGGETDFPNARRRFKGRKGDALIFWNVTPNGQPDPLTLHAGLPPKAGEKWLFSQWIRLRVA